MTDVDDIEREREPAKAGARAVGLLEKLELDPVTQELKPRRHAISLANASANVHQGEQLAGSVVELQDAAGARKLLSGPQ